MKNSLKIYVLTAISFVVGTSQFVIAGILDKVALSVGVSVSTAGQLITAFALATALGTPVVMMLSSKLNRRTQLLMALSLIVVGIVATLTLQGYFYLLIARIILGIGSGTFIVSAYGSAAKLALPGRQGRAMANVALGYSASLILGVPIGRFLSASYDWKIIFWGLGVLTVLGFISVLRWIPKSEAEVPISLTKQLSYLKQPRIAIALCASFMMFVGYSAVTTYVTPLLKALMPMTDQRISFILLGLGIASLVGSKLGGLLADRIGTIPTLFGSMVFQMLCLVVIAFFPIAGVFKILLLMLWGTAAWMCGPTLNFNLISAAPDASGILLSLNSSFVQFGFAAGAGIGGIIIAGASVSGITWVGLSAVALAGVLILISATFSLRKKT